MTDYLDEVSRAAVCPSPVKGGRYDCHNVRPAVGAGGWGLAQSHGPGFVLEITPVGSASACRSTSLV